MATSSSARVKKAGRSPQKIESLGQDGLWRSGRRRLPGSDQAPVLGGRGGPEAARYEGVMPGVFRGEPGRRPPGGSEGKASPREQVDMATSSSFGGAAALQGGPGYGRRLPFGRGAPGKTELADQADEFVAIDSESGTSARRRVLLASLCVLVIVGR